MYATTMRKRLETLTIIKKSDTSGNYFPTRDTIAIDVSSDMASKSIHNMMRTESFGRSSIVLA